MSPEISPQLFLESSQAIKRPIATFARTHTLSQAHIDPEHIRAYIGSQLILRDNPYFHNGEKTMLTGLEPYFIGKTSNPIEVAEEIGTYGHRMIKNLEAFNDPYVVPRIKRLINTTRISTDVDESQKDLQVLFQVDIAIGNTVRKLRAGMTKEAEAFRTETHRIIGNPTARFGYSLALYSESLVLPQMNLQREINVQKQPIDLVLMKLPAHLQRGYNFFSELLRPVFSAPVERSFLLKLKTTRI